MAAAINAAALLMAEEVHEDMGDAETFACVWIFAKELELLWRRGRGGPGRKQRLQQPLPADPQLHDLDWNELQRLRYPVMHEMTGVLFCSWQLFCSWDTCAAAKAADGGPPRAATLNRGCNSRRR